MSFAHVRALEYKHGTDIRSDQNFDHITIPSSLNNFTQYFEKTYSKYIYNGIDKVYSSQFLMKSIICNYNLLILKGIMSKQIIT